MKWYRKPAIIFGIATVSVLLGATIYVRLAILPARLSEVEQELDSRRQAIERQVLAVAGEERMEKAIDLLRRRWFARYKIVPDTLTTPHVVDRLNEETATGFERVDISFKGLSRLGGHQRISYAIDGRATFLALYRLVWDLENERYFYALRDLRLDQIDLMPSSSSTDGIAEGAAQVMVTFSAIVDAYFDAAPTNSLLIGAPSQFLSDETPWVDDEEWPVELLPARFPATNPFRPLILEKLPPNVRGELDVQSARLVAVVGDEAYFEADDTLHTVRIGSDVYLGYISNIDAKSGIVTALLNKGGILDEVVRMVRTDVAAPYDINSTARLR